MATLSVGGTTVFDGSATQGLTSATTFPVGHVLQSLTTDVSSNSVTCTTSANVFTTVPTLQVAITPSATSSKILVIVYIGAFNFSSTNYGIAGMGAFQRKIASGSFTNIGLGSGNATWNGTFSLNQDSNDQYYGGLTAQCSDAPSTTSACTYAIGVADHNNDARTFYLNRKNTTGDNPSAGYFSSAITVMEVKG